MTAQKILQADVNYLSKRLTQQQNSPFAYVHSERKIIPYDKSALTKQYFILKELVADYIDKKQIELFDTAIRIFDMADIARKNAGK